MVKFLGFKFLYLFVIRIGILMILFGIVRISVWNWLFEDFCDYFLSYRSSEEWNKWSCYV